MSDRGLVIMLCRNALHYSRACLKTLQAQTMPVSVPNPHSTNDSWQRRKGFVDILVVDNASSDGTAAWMRGQRGLDKNMRVMSFGDIRSVAECWNRALRWAWGAGYERALVVNTDTELLPNTFEVLNNYMSTTQERIGMATCVSVREREQLTWDGRITETPHPDFSCFMIAKWAHQQVPFDEAYEGAYCEDCDMHVRLHRAGIEAVNLGIPFLHHASGTLKDADPEERRRIERCADANRERFRKTYGCLPGTRAYSELFSGAAEPTLRQQS